MKAARVKLPGHSHPYDEVCGGGILCLIGAIYYDALCTIVSAL